MNQRGPYAQLYSTDTPARPVLSREEALRIARRILELSKADVASVRLEHRTIGITRVNRTRVHTSRDSETISLSLSTQHGGKASIGVRTNQLDDATLQVIVPYLDRMARERLGPVRNWLQGAFDRGAREYLPVELWHEESVQALAETRSAFLPECLAAVRQADLMGAVFAGASARAICLVHSDGLVAYGQETDAEVTVTCWTPDGRASGWGGVASRNWATLDPMAAAHEAIDIANRSRNIQGLEPGRRTAILAPAAVAQLVARMSDSFRASSTHDQQTPFSKPPDESRVGEKVFDERISMRSDPAEPEGGYFPFFGGVLSGTESDGLPQMPVQWVERGILKHLAYSPSYGARRGITRVAEPPYSMCIETHGKTSTVEEMIAACTTGVYVQRFSDVWPVDQKSGQLTGVTRDGCFLIKDGKIDRAVKNFRFVDSPFFSLNSLELIGVPRRAAMGYTPTGGMRWPLPPLIVPPLMVRDFNFAALADAV